MDKRDYRYLFGPVPSRRFGRSLGVDLVPFKFKAMIEGLTQFRRQFRGELWLEVFLVWGTNATPQEVSRIASWAKAVAPDKVQLNTSVRPPCEEYAYAVPEEKMAELAKLFDPPAEVIAEYRGAVSAQARADEVDLLQMLERRPCTLDQVCRVFGWHRNEATKYLGKLTRTGRAQPHRQDGVTYFAGVHEPGARHANV